jgi:hypothetical protein
MYKRSLLYTAIILFPFFYGQKAKAQNREQHRSVTINQTVVDGKVVSSDTIITYTDTTTRTINSKEVSMELPYTKGSTVHIDNTYRKLNIRQSKDSKVRLVTTTYYYGEPTFTNEQWLEKLNIKMQNTDSGISIVSGGINSSGFIKGSWSSNTTTNWNQVIAERNDAVSERIRATEERLRATEERNKVAAERRITPTEQNSAIPVPPTPPTPPTTIITGSGGINGLTINGPASAGRGYTIRSGSGNNTAVFDEKGNNVYNSSSLRRELTLYIPADAKLDVVSKYADVTADHDLKSIKIKVSNGSLDMVNADNVIIISGYSNVSCGNISNADISATNGKLSIKNADQLSLNTKYTKVEADKCNTLVIKSTSDDYDIDEVKNISGTKTYGNLRLDKLTGSFDLKGSSADVKIKNIEPSVSTISLDNKYADVQFPTTTLKNYEVSFAGNYSSVFAPFERRDTTLATTSKQGSQDKINIVTTGQGSTTASGSILAPLTTMNGLNASRRNGQAFTAVVGDTKASHTIFKMVCNSCNVDFK